MFIIGVHNSIWLLTTHSNCIQLLFIRSNSILTTRIHCNIFLWFIRNIYVFNSCSCYHLFEIFKRCIIYCNYYWLIANFEVYLQYIPLIMHTIRALSCFVLSWHLLFCPYQSGMSYWHGRNDMNVQSSAVITRSNIVRYYINNHRGWGRISIRCWIHKRHPIPRPKWRAMGVVF